MVWHEATVMICKPVLLPMPRRPGMRLKKLRGWKRLQRANDKKYRDYPKYL